MFIKRGVKTIVIVLASLALGGPIAAYAQEGSATDSTVPKEPKDTQDLKQEAEIEEQRKVEQQRKKEQTSKAKASKEVFKPTEEISEDSPVPFPIDI